MAYVKLFAATLVAFFVGTECLRIGLGRYDVTGPSVEVPFMGYGSMTQRGIGIHTRQYARAFIIEDESGNRVVFVNGDISAFTHPMKREVLRRLNLRFPNVYSIDNIMLAPTHTHGGPGGYHQLVLYDITCLGFIEETFNPIVSGVFEAIVRAHNSMQDGRVYYSEVPIEDFGINRSPESYLANPATERARYTENIDRNLQQIKFVNSNDQTVGAFNWVATHAVSMNNTNGLISFDNLGYASYLLEQRYNRGHLVGKGPFIGAFSTSNSADISPNTRGPRCYRRGGECDTRSSACPEDDVCKGKGPGYTDTENTSIIGSNIYNAAMIALHGRPQRELTGNVGFVHQFVEMHTQSGVWLNPITQRNESYRGCLPAMGTSFAAGTTDGPGAYSFFEQGDTTGNPFWQLVGNSLRPPTRADRECHRPKPILLMTGGMNWPYLWQPQRLPTQLLKIGNVVVAGVATEITTMAGRRLRDTITKLGETMGEDLKVIPTGMANMYASYLTTPEEYDVQRYEGGSSPYGPSTLTIFQKTFEDQYTALMSGRSLPGGAPPLDETRSQLTFLTPVVMDTGRYGRVVVQPHATYSRHQEVFVTFVSGNPRNDLMTEESFFYVQQLQLNGTWRDVVTDADWETRFIWRRLSTLLGTSEIDFYWIIPANVENGTYRVRHVGAARAALTGIRRYSGTSGIFTIN